MLSEALYSLSPAKCALNFTEAASIDGLLVASKSLPIGGLLGKSEVDSPSTLPGIVNVNLPSPPVTSVVLSVGRFSIPVAASVISFLSIPYPQDL